MLNDHSFSSCFQYTVFYQGFTSAFREVSYGVLMVSAVYDFHELGFIEADHVFEGLFIKSHTSHVIELFIAFFRDRFLLYVGVD